MDYFILNTPSGVLNREAAVAPRGDDPFGMPVGRGPIVDASEVTLRSENLSEAEASKLRRDPANVVGPVMPLVLVAPCRNADYGLPEVDALEAAAGAAWGIGDIGADATDETGAGVRVAVLDTGIDDAHPAFAGVDLRTSRNFIGGGGTDVTDRHGHGTHCAGTLFGRSVGETRIGVAPGITEALIGKVLDDKGHGTTGGLLDALYWAGLEKRVDVISMSLGFDFPGMRERLMKEEGLPPTLATSRTLTAYRENLRAFETMFNLITQEGSGNPGVVIVAASGNESLRNRNPKFVIDATLPGAASPNVISVGATMRVPDGIGIAPFSNINPVLWPRGSTSCPPPRAVDSSP